MLTIATPFGLLALAGIPLIVALHLFRHHYRPRPVSALFLWGAQIQAGGSGRVRQPLQNRWSLWCEILACLALAWLLAEVRLVHQQPGRHLVLVLDSRWCLQAQAPGRPPVWEQARTSGLRALASLTDADRATLIASGVTPRLLAGPAVTGEQVRRALQHFLPDRTDHDLAPTLVLAAQLGGPSAQTLLLSDRPPRDPPGRLGWVARGQPLPTTGLAEVDWTEDRGRSRVLARVVAGLTPCQRTWQLMEVAGNRRLAQGTVEVSPDRPALLSVPVPPETADWLELRLTGPDPLTCDDAARVRRPPSRRLAVQVAVPVDTLVGRAVRDALRSLEDLDLASSGPTHLEIGLGSATPGPGAWRLSLLSGDGPVQLGPFLARAGHPALDGIDGSGLLWAGSAAAAGPGEEVLWSAAGRILLSELRPGPARELRLYADWTRCQLPRHPAWPCLLANVCAWRRAWLPGPERSTVRLGQPFTVQLPRGDAGCDLVSPEAVAMPLIADPDQRVLVAGLDHPGTWLLRGPGFTWPIEAVALDARLADLSAAASGDREPPPARTADTLRDTPPLAHLLPLLLAMAALAAAWLAHRRESGGV